MLPGLGAAAAYALVQRQGAALQDRFEARRDNAADAARFRERAAALPDREALLRDRRTLLFALEAFQLEGEVGKTALIRKVLTSDLGDPGSFANRMADPRWRQFAATLAGTTGKPFGDGAAIDRIVEGAMTNRFERQMGETNPGLREALYFRRMAGKATTVAQVMSDRALTEVARGALGLPDQFGLLTFEQQRSLLTRRLDPQQLQDPQVVERMARRYLALSATATAAPTAASALFGGTGVEGLAPLLGRALSVRA
jgi:hypothetical protein